MAGILELLIGLLVAALLLLGYVIFFVKTIPENHSLTTEASVIDPIQQIEILTSGGTSAEIKQEKIKPKEVSENEKSVPDAFILVCDPHENANTYHVVVLFPHKNITRVHTGSADTISSSSFLNSQGIDPENVWIVYLTRDSFRTFQPGGLTISLEIRKQSSDLLKWFQQETSHLFDSFKSNRDQTF